MELRRSAPMHAITLVYRVIMIFQIPSYHNTFLSPYCCLVMNAHPILPTFTHFLYLVYELGH